MWKWIKSQMLVSSPPHETEGATIDPAMHRRMGINNAPRTLAEELGVSLNRPLVFDPALKQYSAYRGGEPSFDSNEEATRWNEVREFALYHVLRSIQEMPEAEHLVLRGSALMATWFGNEARCPGDLDWVVVPASWTSEQAESQSLISAIEQKLRGSVHSHMIGIEIPYRPFAIEDIWLYEKAPGKRMIVPWNSRDSRCDGTIQLDIVFGEAMPSEPVLTNVVVGDHPPVSLNAASAQQSLAWKLVWLLTDMYGVGKDLYDAVILAEAIEVDLDVLRKTFEVADDGFNPLRDLSAAGLRGVCSEWDDFKKEYPAVTGSVNEWEDRLIVALAPIFAELV